MMQTAGPLAGRGGSPRKQQGQHAPPAQTQAGRGVQRRPAQAVAAAEKDKPLVFKVCWVCTSSRRPPTNTATPPGQARTGVSTLLPWPARLAAKLPAQGKIGTLSDAHASRTSSPAGPTPSLSHPWSLRQPGSCLRTPRDQLSRLRVPGSLPAAAPCVSTRSAGGEERGKGSHDKERRLKLSSGLGSRERESCRWW
jgi:hypothetical protein